MRKLLLAAFLAWTSQALAADLQNQDWVMVVMIAGDGTVSISNVREGNWPESQISPCAAAELVRAAHRARLSPTDTATPNHSIERNVVITSIDGKGHVFCDRLFRVVVDEAIEIPPTTDGRVGFSWTRRRPESFSLIAAIPKLDVAALRISGWRGVKPATFRVADPAQHFVK